MSVNKFRAAAAVIGAGALITMGTMTVARPSTQPSASPVAPQHFGGPVNTSIDNPPADLGVPTSTPPTAAPLNAPPPPGTVVGTQ
jgi:hypothetical protein